MQQRCESVGGPLPGEDAAKSEKVLPMDVYRRGRCSCFAYCVGRLFCWFFGWRVQGPVPEFPKFVVIFAPHTSNWDLPVMLAVSFVLRVKGHWLAKDAIFWGPCGWFFRGLGGIPVDRSSRAKTVDQAVQAFEQNESMVLAMAPGGTRAYRDHWKSGFYRIALQAKVPIVLSFADYDRRVAGNGGTLWPTGDVEADLAQIQAFYDTVEPRHPEWRSLIRFLH